MKIQPVTPYTIYSTTQSAWDAMYEALREAKRSIYWELYIFVDDEAGKRFFDLLEKKAKDGLEVKLILDAMGSYRVSNDRIASLKAAGVDLIFFHGVGGRPATWWRRMYARTHRKILIIDATVGFIGGVNIEQRMAAWLDIHLRVSGTVVRSLMRSFAKSYIIGGGEKKNVAHLFRSPRLLREKGEAVTEFIDDTPDKNISHVRQKYTDALARARRRVILFTPYYFPDKYFLRALWQARRRGVHIDLLIPFRTDVRLATYAAYAGFSLLRRYGVHIHFLREMMHGKGMVVDDELAIVGSSNLDQTSFYDNYEANIRIRDRRVVKRLRRVLTGWMRRADRFEDETWKKRSAWQRLKEGVAYVVYRIWHRH